jgi:hypothetical protein
MATKKTVAKKVPTVAKKEVPTSMKAFQQKGFVKAKGYKNPLTK